MKFKDEDILQLYREAKDKSKEIKILAELNTVPVKEIRQFLIERGIEVPEDKRFKDEKPAKVKPEVAAASPEIPKQTVDIPEPIIKILREKRGECITKINKLKNDVMEIDRFIGPT